jgi:general secretion pathway protein C
MEPTAWPKIRGAGCQVGSLRRTNGAVSSHHAGRAHRPVYCWSNSAEAKVMETLLRRWMWLVDAAAIAIAAIAMARAAGRLLSRLEIAGLPRQLIEEYVASQEETPAKKIEAILKRNIFRSRACEGVEPEIDSIQPPLSLRLIAVMYAPRLADKPWSVAIIRSDDEKTTLPFIVGSRLHDATIDAIEATRVHLHRGDGQRFVLDLTAPPPRLAPMAEAPVESAGVQSFRDGIRQLGERRYEVQRRTLEAWLANPRQLAMDVRVLPEARGGNSAGIRLDHMPPSGAFAAIGLRNGDVIRAVNGLDLDSPEHALDAYLKLRLASHISLAADRGGQRINIEYDIR